MSAPQPPPITFPPDLQRKYQITRELGQGAYGIVW